MEISGLALYWRFLRYASLRSKWIGIFHPLALCPLRTLATSSLSFSDSLLDCPARGGLHLENYSFVLSEVSQTSSLSSADSLLDCPAQGGLHLENYSFVLSEVSQTSSLSSADSPSAYLADEKSFGFSTL